MVSNLRVINVPDRDAMTRIDTRHSQSLFPALLRNSWWPPPSPSPPPTPHHRSIMRKRGWHFWYRHNIADKWKRERVSRGNNTEEAGRKKKRTMIGCRCVNRSIKGWNVCTCPRKYLQARTLRTIGGAHVLFGLLPFVNNGCRFKRARSDKD